MKAGTAKVAAKTYDVIVIGGGPAGMMAAGRAAGRGLSVLLLEKNDSLGKKLLITGGGRCNVTNAEFDDRALLAKYKGSDKFLFSAFAQHSVKESLEFFHSRGMETKVEAEKRAFPVSNSAKSVWTVLVAELKKHNVAVRSNAKATGLVTSKAGHIEAVRLSGGEELRARSFILATGGISHPETGSTGDGFKWLKKIGHKVAEPTASLVPIVVKDRWVKQLSGFSLQNSKVTIVESKEVKKGKILFTHFGLSGPAVLNMSNEIGELLKHGEVALSLDLLPQHDYATLNAALQELFSKDINKMIKNALGGKGGLIPSALVPAVIEASGIRPETFCNGVTREERLTLVKTLKDMRIQPTGLLGAEKAIITSGGVDLTEIDWKTMRSRLFDNLHIVGDLLDIDRPSGGYSLQLCWTTGWVAGNSVGSAAKTSA